MKKNFRCLALCSSARSAVHAMLPSKAMSKAERAIRLHACVKRLFMKSEDQQAYKTALRAGAVRS